MAIHIHKSTSTIAILGATGFLGLHLSKTLVQKGYKNIIGFSRTQPNKELYPHLEQLTWYIGDFTNEHLIEEIAHKSDFIFHFISNSTPLTSGNSTIKTIESQLIPTLKLLEALKGKSTKLIYASSGGAIYGKPTILPIPESNSLQPTNAYGIQKLVTEQYLRLYKIQFDLQYLSLRIGNPYGEYQNPKKNQGIIRKYLDNIIHNQSIEVWGDGRSSRDYIYIDDLMDCFLKCITYEGTKTTFNVGSGKSHSILDILNILESVSNKDLTVSYKKVKQVHAQIPEIQLDINSIKQELLWEPKTPLEKGMKLLFNTLIGDKLNE